MYIFMTQLNKLNINYTEDKRVAVATKAKHDNYSSRDYYKN